MCNYWRVLQGPEGQNRYIDLWGVRNSSDNTTEFCNRVTLIVGEVLWVSCRPLSARCKFFGMNIYGAGLE